MHRLVISLFLVLGVVSVSSSPASAQQMSYDEAMRFVEAQGIIMWTKPGAPNLHRGRHCYGCHKDGPPQVRNVMAPQEPCFDCHREMTAAQEQIADMLCRTHPSICPIILRDPQPNGRVARAFFGLR